MSRKESAMFLQRTSYGQIDRIAGNLCRDDIGILLENSLKSFES